MKNAPANYRRMARRRSGQTIVETALVLTFILVPLLLGILQFGLVMNATNTLNQVAREGARYAAVHGTEANSDDAIKNYVQAVVNGTSIKSTDLPDENITIAMTPLVSTASVPARSSGNPITVTIKYNMGNKIFLPNFPLFNTLKRDVYAQSTFVLE